MRNSLVFPTWTGYGSCFWYERETSVGRQYRLVDADTRINSSAFKHEGLARALAAATRREIDPENLPIKNVIIHMAPRTVTFNGCGQQWTYHESDETCERIENQPSACLISPDGRKAAFTRDFNLWIRDISSGHENALTRDGEELAAYAAARDAWGREVQAVWSPDSSRLFTLKRDVRLVKTNPVVEHVPSNGSLRPVARNVLAGLAGDEHLDEFRMLAIDVATGRIIEAEYLSVPPIRDGRGYFDAGMGWWAMDSQVAWFVDLERGAKAVRIVEFNTSTGKTRVVFEERGSNYVSIEPNIEDYPVLRSLPETNEIIWYSLRTGWAHLYLYDLQTGSMKRAITAGQWNVRDVLHFDADRRELYIQTAGRVRGRDPYYRDICRCNIDTSEMRTLVSSNHDYVVLAKHSYTHFGFRGLGRDLSDGTRGIAPDARYFVATRSRADEAPASFLFDREGNQVMEVEAADISGLPTGWQWPEPVHLTAADGGTDIYGVVFKPSDFSSEHKYPIVDYVANYPDLAAAPKGSFSNEQFLGKFYLSCAAIAELGFIVVMIDGRGSGQRNAAFQDASYGWLPAASNLADHVAGIRQLAARFQYIDLNRVGITGCEETSAAVHGLLEYPDFFKVGVAVNMLDSRLCSAALYVEKYEGLPSVRKERLYPEALVDQLDGQLFLIHNLLRTVTPPAGTFRLVDALQRANKDFEMLMLPNAGHVTPGYCIRRCWDFLVKHLLGIEPPAEFELTCTTEILRKQATLKN